MPVGEGRSSVGTVRKGLLGNSAQRYVNGYVPIEDLSFPTEVERVLNTARRIREPFWPIFSAMMVAVDVVISLAIIVLGALTVSFRTDVRVSSEDCQSRSTILMGSAALLKGMGLPNSAYRL